MTTQHKQKTNSIEVEIGFRIRQARQSQKMTQKEIAAHLGISCQQFQKYEQGTNRIPVSRLIKVAQILCINPSDLFNTSTLPTKAAPAKMTKVISLPLPATLPSDMVSLDRQAYDLWHQLGSAQTKRLVLDLMQSLRPSKLSTIRHL